MTNKNTGHGHVRPRPDGVKARCGGPTICTECGLEEARLPRDGMARLLRNQEFWTALGKEFLPRLREKLSPREYLREHDADGNARVRHTHDVTSGLDAPDARDVELARLRDEVEARDQTLMVNAAVMAERLDELRKLRAEVAELKHPPPATADHAELRHRFGAAPEPAKCCSRPTWEGVQAHEPGCPTLAKPSQRPEPAKCEACAGNVAPGKTCWACGLAGPVQPSQRPEAWLACKCSPSTEVGDCPTWSAEAKKLRAQLAAAQAELKDAEQAGADWRDERDDARDELQAATERADKADLAFSGCEDTLQRVCEERDAERKANHEKTRALMERDEMLQAERKAKEHALEGWDVARRLAAERGHRADKAEAAAGELRTALEHAKVELDHPPDATHREKAIRIIQAWKLLHKALAAHSKEKPADPGLGPPCRCFGVAQGSATNCPRHSAHSKGTT